MGSSYRTRHWGLQNLGDRRELAKKTVETDANIESASHDNVAIAYSGGDIKMAYTDIPKYRIPVPIVSGSV